MNKSNESAKKKLSYTHNILISNEKLIILKNLMLQNEYDNEFIDAEDEKDHDQDMKDIAK